MLTIHCTRCWAPLQVPDVTPLLTCSTCHAYLKVVQTDGAIFTSIVGFSEHSSVVGQINENRSTMPVPVAAIAATAIMSIPAWLLAVLVISLPLKQLGLMVIVPIGVLVVGMIAGGVMLYALLRTMDFDS